jgi:hypothetical protein
MITTCATVVFFGGEIRNSANFPSENEKKIENFVILGVFFAGFQKNGIRHI